MADLKESSVEKKIARLEAIREKIQEFEKAGGDMESQVADPLCSEFIDAFDDLAREPGYEFLKPVEGAASGDDSKGSNLDPTWKGLGDLFKLFTFDKKRDLEKYCRELVIDSSAFAKFIMACEAGILPYKHQIHYRDYMPESLHLTAEDHAAMAANGVGPVRPGARKAINKMAQMFRDRRYLVGHIFYVPDLSVWHFFQFDQRDLEERNNHWKEGSHIHFLNWLWPNFDAQTLWRSFTTDRVKMNTSLHVRYLNSAKARRPSRDVF
jgi:hypothetical protein